MLTLNSGICGTITEQIEFFASGTLLPQSEYDAGIRYFSKLKKVSSLYLKSCGLVFRSDSTSIDDILAFAVRAHAGHGSTMTDKVLAGLAG